MFSSIYLSAKFKVCRRGPAKWLDRKRHCRQSPQAEFHFWDPYIRRKSTSASWPLISTHGNCGRERGEGGKEGGRDSKRISKENAPEHVGVLLSHSPLGPHWSLVDPFSSNPWSQENSQLDPLWKGPEALGRHFMEPHGGLDKALHWKAETSEKGWENIMVILETISRLMAKFKCHKALLRELKTILHHKFLGRCLHFHCYPTSPWQWQLIRGNH